MSVLMHLSGCCFEPPPIRDLSETELYPPLGKVRYPALKAMSGRSINLKEIHTHWKEILSIATWIGHGTVTASLMLQKLGNHLVKMTRP
jgi:TnpA family transposase